MAKRGLAMTPVEERAQTLAAELDRFVQIVVEHLRPERIIVFGSFASGQVGEWSDLDVVVVAETDLPFLERLKQVILLVRPTVGMDIVVYTPEEWEYLKTSRLFVREEIAKKGKVVYERGEPAVA
jgi:predicted nucleotidyltransferase